jgi:hypothetical protein
MKATVVKMQVQKRANIIGILMETGGDGVDGVLLNSSSMSLISFS